jgi:hypothetical protein
MSSSSPSLDLDIQVMADRISDEQLLEWGCCAFPLEYEQNIGDIHEVVWNAHKKAHPRKLTNEREISGLALARQ